MARDFRENYSEPAPPQNTEPDHGRPNGAAVKVGDSFTSRGQRYECLDRFEHEIPAKWVWIYTLRSTCPDCGRKFECTATKTQRKNYLLSRRCERCQAPGRPVVRKATKIKREDSSMTCENPMP